eukprot:6201641-Pleurochrysis_carterae.AAC.6
MSKVYGGAASDDDCILMRISYFFHFVIAPHAFWRGAPRSASKLFIAARAWPTPPDAPPTGAMAQARPATARAPAHAPLMARLIGVYIS